MRGQWGRSTEPTPLAVPTAAADRTQGTRTSCHRVHVFKAGETLESIAAAELGDATKWQQIRIANREWLDLAENGLEPGARLTLPVPCPG
nr:LysM peptidoglycan-binding domain-containing protein [Ramlibacter monticola]